MPNIPRKFKLTQTSTNGIVTKEFNLDKTKGNAFRIDKIQVCIPDFDAIADGDEWCLQLCTEEKTALLEINDDDEILTIGERFSLTQGTAN